MHNDTDKRTMTEDEDRRAVMAFQKGDRKAFDDLVVKYREKAYFIALGFVGNRDEALDISQEAFIKVYNNIDRFESDRSFFPWFYEILKNTALNILRKRKSFQSLKSILPYKPADDKSFNPETLQVEDEQSRLVWEALGKLDPEDREIIFLKHFQNLSYKEIARLQNIPVGTVMSRLYYARLKLKKSLQPFMEE